jgi:erythromycin esterase
VRFLGADVLEPRALQYAEVERFVADVAPAGLARVRALLAILAMRGGRRERWALVATARELDALVRDVASTRPARRGRSAVDPDDAVLHAFALLGFYESRSAAGGDDVRDRYAAGIVAHWRERTAHQIVYAAV